MLSFKVQIEYERNITIIKFNLIKIQFEPKIDK
jgi:hypothetical protein